MTFYYENSDNIEMSRIVTSQTHTHTLVKRKQVRVLCVMFVFPHQDTERSQLLEVHFVVAEVNTHSEL